MKISRKLISATILASLLAAGSIFAAPAETVLGRRAVASARTYVAPSNPASRALAFGHSGVLFELASNNASGPCQQPQAPRAIGLTNTKKKILNPTTVPPCTPVTTPTSHG